MLMGVFPWHIYLIFGWRFMKNQFLGYLHWLRLLTNVFKYFGFYHANLYAITLYSISFCVHFQNVEDNHILGYSLTVDTETSFF